ncbi:hypothetical protein [Paracoccus seriniphilus]|nr:hypothetical protein [Paracoccus seriniphilus]
MPRCSDAVTQSLIEVVPVVGADGEQIVVLLVVESFCCLLADEI